MKKVAVDYKGKHFMIFDEDAVGDFDILDPYVDAEKVIKEHLKSHVADCIYYGIPAYVGKDEELKKKINQIEEELEEIEK